MKESKTFRLSKDALKTSILRSVVRHWFYRKLQPYRFNTGTKGPDMSVCITEVDYIYLNSGFYGTKFIVCNIELLVICGSTFIPILPPPSRVHLDGGGGGEEEEVGVCRWMEGIAVNTCTTRSTKMVAYLTVMFKLQINLQSWTKVFGTLM